jgi:hypothetical protein
MPEAQQYGSYSQFEYFGMREYWSALLFIIYMMLGAFFLYRGPSFLGPMMQLAVLMLFYRSRKPWLWIAVFMFTSFVPGALYHFALNRNLIILSQSFIGSLTFTLAFSLIAMLKAVQSGRKGVFYKTHWFLCLIYLLFLIPFYGAKLTYLIKGFAGFSLMISIPMLLVTQDDYNNLFLYIFMGNFFVLGTSLFQISMGYPFVRLLGGSAFRDLNIFLVEDTQGIIRSIWGVEYSYLALIGTLFYLAYKRSPFRNSFLYISLLIGWLNIVFSATRGWIIASTLVIALYSFIMIPRLFRRITIMAPIIALMFLLLMQIPVVSSQISKALSRLQTSESILEGEITDEATGGRASTGKIIMDVFKENPLVGWGYGSTAMNYLNLHAGNQSMLMQFGAIGYTLFLILWIMFILKLFQRARIHHLSSDYRNTLYVPALAFLGLFMIHSTSGMMIHPFSVGVFVSFVFALGDFLYRQGSSNLQGLSSTAFRQ